MLLSTASEALRSASDGCPTTAVVSSGKSGRIRRGKSGTPLKGARDGGKRSRRDETQQRQPEEMLPLLKRHEVQVLRNLALAGFIGAGVGAAATVATFLLWKPAPKNQAALRVTPVASPRALGLGVVGRF